MIKERFNRVFEANQATRIAKIAELYKAEDLGIFTEAAQLSVLETLRSIAAMSDEGVPEAWFAIANTAKSVDPVMGDALLGAIRECGN